jgi:hypothetical protein
VCVRSVLVRLSSETTRHLFHRSGSKSRRWHDLGTHTLTIACVAGITADSAISGHTSSTRRIICEILRSRTANLGGIHILTIFRSMEMPSLLTRNIKETLAWTCAPQLAKVLGWHNRGMRRQLRLCKLFKDESRHADLHFYLCTSLNLTSPEAHSDAGHAP